MTSYWFCDRFSIFTWKERPMDGWTNEWTFLLYKCKIRIWWFSNIFCNLYKTSTDQRMNKTTDLVTDTPSFILGDIRSIVRSYFFHFFLCHANLGFFSSTVQWQMSKRVKYFISKAAYYWIKFSLWPHQWKRFWKTNCLV